MPVRRIFAFSVDLARHREIGALMYIGVTDALEMAHHGHARVLLHARDQALAAARHDHVDVARHVAQHDAHRLAVLRRQHLHRVLRQPVRDERAREACVNRGARARALGAAAQDRRVAAFRHNAAASAVTFGRLS